MSKKTLNKANLAALGADRLSDLLMEISAGSADIKRRLRMELSHNLGPQELARDVRKRLTSLRTSKGFIGWRKRKALIKDLSIQLAMITDKVAPEDPTLGFDMLWEFIEMAPAIYGRTDDSKGDVGDVFRGALAHFDAITPSALVTSSALAGRTWDAILNNDFGQWDGLLEQMAPALGAEGLEALRQHVLAFEAEPVTQDGPEHDAIVFLRQLRGGDDYAAKRKTRFVKACLQQIAAAAGDTQAYVAQYSQDDLERKDIAAEVAQMMLADGQTDQALSVLEAAAHSGDPFDDTQWDDVYLDTLIALGRTEDAQVHRHASFAATLNPVHLRAYLKHLPDFDDFEAEEHAKELVQAFPNFPAALDFCVAWPDLHGAAQLIENRADEIGGNHGVRLIPAAEALRSRYPLAAALIWRAMIVYVLNNAIKVRYGLAADHFADCIAVDVDITDYGKHPSHDAFVHALRDRFARSYSFWEKVN